MTRRRNVPALWLAWALPVALGGVLAGAGPGEGGTFSGPMTVALHCPTQGVSIAYTTDTGDEPHWLLYAGPLRLAEGRTTVRARAIRYGYEASPELVGLFVVN